MEQTKNKGRILWLLEYLYKYTDEEHMVTTNELIEELVKQGYSANRKTVKDDIGVLTDAGFDIITVRTTSNAYFWGGRMFEMPELKLLVDAVSSSKFISRDKSVELIEKISGLASENQSRQLVRRLYTRERIKPDNGQIYYIVDCLAEAVRIGRRVRFQYSDYTPDKEKVLKNNGEVYECSPYALVWNEDFYYLIGHSVKHNKVVTFRVDRVVKPEITDADSFPEPEGFSVSEYVKQVFDMYDGTQTQVELACDNELMKVIIDRFGEDIQTQRISDTQFMARVMVSASRTFFGWVFQFAGRIRIAGPENVVGEYRKLAAQSLNGYDM